MAINIKFDLTGSPEPPTILLATKNGSILGQLDVNPDSIDMSDKFNDASEFSFALNKYVDDEITNLWDKVVNFKLVYCKEWNMWFEITVELDEETETVKTVFCKQLGQAELSQIILYNIEINTEDDIARDDYKITILYDENNKEASLLHRLLKDKAPHYSIIHVDPTIAKIQRSFSFDGTSIYDAFMEIAEEIGCLFIFHSNSDKDGKIQRIISVHDLQQNCKDCGHRGEFTDKCPKCGSINIDYGYGEDTLIFVTSDELASAGIELTTDTDAIKNCFKLETGDDLMTATVRNCNPNGTDYIWIFSNEMKSDMSKELIDALDSYNTMYQDHYSNHESVIDSSMVNKYNALIEKYNSRYCLDCGHVGYFKDECPKCKSKNIALQLIPETIKGYSSLMNAYYNVIDLSLYLESSMMPSVEMSETTAEEQASLLTSSSISKVAVNNDNIASVSLATADSAVLSMAKIIVRSTYKVEIGNSEYNKDTHIWSGNFIITNYSDEDDAAESQVIKVTVNNDTETFARQKIDKALNKEDTDDYSISGLFKKELVTTVINGKNVYSGEFCEELKKYALNPLKSFYDACDACLGILIDQGAGNENEKPDLYKKLYKPYYEKSSAISEEIKIREEELNLINGIYVIKKDADGKDVSVLDKKGIKHHIEDCRKTIQDALNFQNYLGEELWLEFCCYRREDTYSNDNYISDGLNNAELFKKASEFFEVAENEIYKSSESQHSISTALNNLLAIPKFKSLVNSFNVGNWIRVQVNDEVYKLRLLEYGIDFGSFDNISVEFSDVTKIKNGITDVQNVLSQASSMATSYSSVQRQASQGEESKVTVDEWLSKGLNSAQVRIQNNNTEDIVLGKNGLLCRSYDELNDIYSPEQLRITHNIMAYTNDDWNTVSTALGRHNYRYWNGASFVDGEDYGLSTKFVTAGYVTGSQIIGGEIVSSNYVPNKKGTYINLIEGDFDFGGGKLVYDAKGNTITLSNVTIDWNTTDAPEVTIENISGMEEYLEQLENLEEQLDGRAQTWYQDKDPSIDWNTNDLKATHLGDLWHYTGETATVNGVKRTKNSEWIWGESNGVYQWTEIEISDIVFDAIDGKAQIFTSQPTPPYYEGDLWVQGSTGDILHCVVERITGSYNASDWIKSSKYTDDTVANSALAQAQKGVADAAQGISLANAAQATANQANTNASNAETNAKNYADAQDGSLKTTLTNAYQTYTNSQISNFDSYVAKYLGLGGNTIIGSNYVISPIIEGGYLNITNTANNSKVIIDPNNLTGNNFIFQVHNGSQVAVGVDSSGNAVFNGTVYATDGRFTGTVSGSSIDGGSITIGNNFSVNPDGVLSATGANISGSISADDGKIGGFSIYSNTLVSNNKIKIDSGGKIKLVSDSTLTDGNEKYYSTFYVSGGILQISGSSTNTLDNNTGYTTDNKYPRISIDPWGIDGFTYDSSTSWFTIYNLDKQISIRDTDGEFINHGNSIFIGEAEARSGLHTSSISSVDFIYLKGNGEISDENRYTVKLSYGNDYGYFMSSYNTSGGTSYTNLGGSNHKWRNVYATNGTIETSDRNSKKDIELLSEKYINMFDLLEPVSYKMIDGDRTHTGFIAQDVEKAMDKVGLTSLDFGGFCKDVKTVYDAETKTDVPILDENGDYKYSYSLRYNEFISLNTAKIKQLEQLILQLQEEIKELKS